MEYSFSNKRSSPENVSDLWLHFVSASSFGIVATIACWSCRRHRESGHGGSLGPAIPPTTVSSETVSVGHCTCRAPWAPVHRTPALRSVLKINRDKRRKLESQGLAPRPTPVALPNQIQYHFVTPISHTPGPSCPVIPPPSSLFPAFGSRCIFFHLPQLPRQFFPSLLSSSTTLLHLVFPARPSTLNQSRVSQRLTENRMKGETYGVQTYFEIYLKVHEKKYFGNLKMLCTKIILFLI